MRKLDRVFSTSLAVREVPYSNIRLQTGFRGFPVVLHQPDIGTLP
jgi:hypothetical protein